MSTQPIDETECKWGPLEPLTDYPSVNGVHPIGHRCLVHERHLLNVRRPDLRRLEEVLQRRPPAQLDRKRGSDVNHTNPAD